ncbi:MAG TPA: hypothetical protein VJ783_16625 [Pirellulales bacterium]|nr:hypothetical protein [Pirellulales bacterium]
MVLLAGAVAVVAAAPAAADDDVVQRRVRELIYLLRQHRVFERTDEWASAIRELTDIGPAAVPELVRELETTDRDFTLRALGFTLRAIGDRRAVPHLIRAIPKTLRPPGSDCGCVVTDEELFAFMKLHDRSPGEGKHFSYGRPVNEILDTLEKLTGHREPPGDGQRDDLRHVFLGGSDVEQTAQRKRFEERMQAWQAWWGKNWRQFVTERQLATVAIVPRPDDLVARDGLAKFGPLFPTGAGVRLGPVREVVLESAQHWDAKSHIDFDTGRVYEYLEQLDLPDGQNDTDFGARVKTWYRQHGIDARSYGSVEGQDLFVWLVDDSRWETLEDEIRKGEDLKLGREATSYLVPFGDSRNDFQWDRGGVFLITTRDGGRGIVKTFPADKKSRRCRLQYRLFLVDGAEATNATEPEIKTRGTRFDEAKEMTLPAPAVDVKYLLDLKTGGRSALIEGAQPETPGQRSAIEADEALLGWCREQGIDVASYVSSGLVGVTGGVPPPPRKNPIQLVGLDMTALQVSEKAFDTFSIERVHEIVSRRIGKQATVAWMDPYPEDAPGLYTWVIQTRDRHVGLLQIVKTSEKPQSITFRYRLANDPTHAESAPAASK